MARQGKALVDVLDEVPSSVDLSMLRYDYEQINLANRGLVRQAAVAIHRDAANAQASMIAMGQQLLKVKALLPHGQFTDWIAAEFEFSDRMAQNFMNVARQYSDSDNRAAVSLFSPSALFVLAAPSTPEEVRAAIEVKAEENGKAPSRAEIRQAIQEYKGVEVAAPAGPTYATVGELQMILGNWLRSEFQYWGGPEKEIAALELMASDGEGNKLPAVIKLLTPAAGIAAYRAADLVQAVRSTLEAKLRQKATIDAQPKPPPPPPSPPGEWAIRSVIRDWLDKREEMRPQDKYDLLILIREQMESHPEYAALIKVLPERWRKKEFDEAITYLLASISQDFGQDEWETRQLPSGNWYAVNGGRNPVATLAFATADEALADKEKASSSRRHFYDSLHGMVAKEESWAANGIQNGSASELVEIKAALQQRLAEGGAPSFVAKRLKMVASRVEAARKLIEALEPVVVVQDAIPTVMVCLSVDVAEALRDAASAYMVGSLTEVEHGALEDALREALANANQALAVP